MNNLPYGRTGGPFAQHYAETMPDAYIDAAEQEAAEWADRQRRLNRNIDRFLLGCGIVAVGFFVASLVRMAYALS